MEWKFSQVFGEGRTTVDDGSKADLVSAIEFDDTGDLIAVGDRGGRIVLFEREKILSNGKKVGSGNNNSSIPAAPRSQEYRFYSEFQSHEPEFDYLKSLEIEEKINKIKWCKRTNANHFLISTNDKTIKLWKVYDKKVRSAAATNPKPPKSIADVKIPSLDVKETVVSAVPRRVFSNAHAYHINSISVNSDAETYISSDDLRINLWNLSISDQSFNIVDIKPANMEELTEVITSAEFHPHHCNIFMYSSSKGTIKLADMRQAALCDRTAKVFEEEEEMSNKSFFSEIISSISDIKFSRDGRYILSRDYMSVKLWDLNMEKKPVKTINIHDHLRSKLCDLYENDCIFDKFECALSPDANYVLTGSYNNSFSILEKNGKSEISLEATKVPNKAKKPVKTKGGKKKGKDDMGSEGLDFSKKILHVAWHPSDNIVAVGAANNLFLFTV